MELLELTPPDLGIATAGVYVIDDDGAQILAGPFPDATDALAWIERRHTGPITPPPSAEASFGGFVPL